MPFVMQGLSISLMRLSELAAKRKQRVSPGVKVYQFPQANLTCIWL